jgi:hypothetical protein
MMVPEFVSFFAMFFCRRLSRADIFKYVVDTVPIKTRKTLQPLVQYSHLFPGISQHWFSSEATS